MWEISRMHLNVLVYDSAPGQIWLVYFVYFIYETNSRMLKGAEIEVRMFYLIRPMGVLNRESDSYINSIESFITEYIILFNSVF